MVFERNPGLEMRYGSVGLRVPCKQASDLGRKASGKRVAACSLVPILIRLDLPLLQCS